MSLSASGTVVRSSGTVPASTQARIPAGATTKTIAALEQLGYVARGPDPRDARRKVVRLTSRGTDALVRSARVFDELRDRWAAVIGPDRLRAMEADLRALTAGSPFRLDVPGWFGTD